MYACSLLWASSSKTSLASCSACLLLYLPPKAVVSLLESISQPIAADALALLLLAFPPTLAFLATLSSCTNLLRMSLGSEIPACIDVAHIADQWRTSYHIIYLAIPMGIGTLMKWRGSPSVDSWWTSPQPFLSFSFSSECTRAGKLGNPVPSLHLPQKFKLGLLILDDQLINFWVVVSLHFARSVLLYWLYWCRSLIIIKQQSLLRVTTQTKNIPEPIFVKSNHFMGLYHKKLVNRLMNCF